MVQLIVGDKGKGKTKQLLEKVNNEVKSVSGNIVYLDKSTKHMYELNNKIRLIDVSSCMIENSSEFIGFICGIISQDHDLQQIYLDRYRDIACIKADNSDLDCTILKLEKISESTGIDFIISVSLDESVIPDSIKKDIIVAL